VWVRARLRGCGVWGVVVGHLVVDDDDEVLDVEAARLVRGWGWGWG
jgi:hypothetical protein